MVKHTPKKITSSQHPLVKHLVKLRQNRTYREECQTALVPSFKLVKELGATITPLLIMAKEDEPLYFDAPFYIVPEEILKKVTGVPSPEGVVAEFPLPRFSSLEKTKALLVLDSVTDPGNMGTLLRTALAFGWEGVFLLPGCVDPFNDKVIRASRGASFYIPMQMGTWEDLDRLIKQENMNIYVADMEGTPIHQVSPSKPMALLLSNEATGVSKEGALLGNKITIPIMDEMESLNVAIAGSILMFYLKNANAHSF